MPITQISVGASRTINLGNFESLRVEASVVYEIDTDVVGQGRPLEVAEDAVQIELRKLLELTYRNMTTKNGKLER